MSFTKYFNRCVATCVVFCLIVLNLNITPVYAADLSDISISLSSYTANEEGVSYSFSFKTGSTNLIKQIDIRFSTEQGGILKPSHLDLSNSTLENNTFLGYTDWSLVTSRYSEGILSLIQTDVVNINNNTVGLIKINNITNSAIDDCETSFDTLEDTCHITITSYSDTGTTAVNSGTSSVTISEPPSLSFKIEGVSKDTNTNGIITNIDTTGTKVSYGNLQAGRVYFGAQKLTIATNAPHGYVVYARLQDGMKGMYVDSKIDPFSNLNAAWNSPQLWSSPDGMVANENTGWVGANTSDHRVPGWEGNTEGKFGPFSIFDHVVSQSLIPQRDFQVTYITFALEVNGAQPADSYSASILYNVLATY